MALSAGTRIGPYEILSALGSGGMGEVYRARDAKLNRDVAVKVLLPAVAHDAERLARFRREAQVLASINHQNIAHVHGFEDVGEHGALVMELVEGHTLAERLAASALPLDEALAVARQLADALVAAHDQAIVHRDLKPANIKVKADGTVKVLDFGLAKALDTEPSHGGAHANAPTLTAALSMPGQILGTAAYMAPEQVKGRRVDKRADLWAFGCVLFEMLSGHRVFDGDSMTEVLARVIEREPDWTMLPATTPPAIRTLLRRCLEKDPKRRLDSAAAARLDIEDAAARLGSSEPSSAEQRLAIRRWPRSAILVAGALMLAVATLAAIAAWLMSRPPQATATAVTRFAIALPPAEPLAFSFNDRDLAIAADGTRVVYTAGDQAQLMVRNLNALEAVPLAGITNARAPFLSPDGQWIGYSDRLDEGTNVGPVVQRGFLRRVPAGGGPPSTIVPLTGASRGASWGPDDSIIFATSDPSTGLLRVRVSGGEPEVLTRPDEAAGERDHYYPSVLPDGRGVLFTIAGADSGVNRRVALFDTATGKHETVIRSGSQAEYVEPGYIVYVDGGALWAVPFSLGTLAVEADPVLIDRILTFGVAATASSAFSISRTGTLVSVPAAAAGLRSLVWVNRAGIEEPIGAPPQNYQRVRLSPDGARLALQMRLEPGVQHVWTWDVASERLSRLTFERSVNTQPVWSVDGRHLFYGSVVAPDVTNLFRRASDGTGSEERLTTSDRGQRTNSISPDGTWLVFEELTPSAGYDFLMVSIAGPPRVEPLLQGPFDERGAEISPDGRWMAYESNESGQEQIYVRPFPDAQRGLHQVSFAGGRTPVWAANGRELYFVTRTSVMSVPVQLTPAFKAGNPSKLFDAHAYALDGRLTGGGTVRTFDVARDGNRFLMIKHAGGSSDSQSPGSSIIVVQNWIEELKAKLPTAR